MEAGFRLTKRDTLILKAVNDCQALTVEQLQVLFWNSPNPAYTRLRKLVKHGYLVKHYITQITAGPAASPMILTISSQGAAVLAVTFGYSKDDFHFISRQVKNWKTYQPIRAVNDFRVRLMRSCRESDEYDLVEWRNEAVFRARPDHVFVRGKKKPVYPDGFCVVTRGRARSFNFIEVDSGTEGLAQFKGQIEIYQAYVQSGLYEQTFGTRFWRVLVITNSARRMENLRRKVCETGGEENYWFATFDRIQIGGLLSEPIWMKARGKVTYTLIPSQN